MKHSKKGFLVIAVVFTTVVILILIGSFLAMIRFKISLIEKRISDSKTYYTAVSGINYGLWVHNSLFYTYSAVARKYTSYFAYTPPVSFEIKNGHGKANVSYSFDPAKNILTIKSEGILNGRTNIIQCDCESGYAGYTYVNFFARKPQVLKWD